MAGIAGQLTREGVTPQSLSRFEHDLHAALGEVGRAVEKAVLEEADIERPMIEHEGLRHYWKYKGPQEAAEVGEVSELATELYEARIHEGEESVPEGTAIVTISRDGTCVNIRHDGWRQAQVGAISCYGESVTNEEGEEERPRLRTAYLGQMPEENTPTFDEKFDREVEHTLRGLSRRALLACIADGSQSIWKYFENHPQLKKAVHINDFWHAAEKLSAVSAALFGKGTSESEAWFKKYRHI